MYFLLFLLFIIVSLLIYLVLNVLSFPSIWFLFPRVNYHHYVIENHRHLYTRLNYHNPSHWKKIQKKSRWSSIPEIHSNEKPNPKIKTMNSNENFKLERKTRINSKITFPIDLKVDERMWWLSSKLKGIEGLHYVLIYGSSLPVLENC